MKRKSAFENILPFGVYRVTRSFLYNNDFLIQQGELLKLVLEADHRVSGGLWYGFKRDTIFFTDGKFQMIGDGKVYNANLIPPENIELYQGIEGKIVYLQRENT